jgi:hypothetical protein
VVVVKGSRIRAGVGQERGFEMARRLLLLRLDGAAWTVEPRTRSDFGARQKGKSMLWTIFVILLILWLLGMVTSNTLGGFIHILLVVAIVVVLIRVIQGRNPV